MRACVLCINAYVRMSVCMCVRVYVCVIGQMGLASFIILFFIPWEPLEMIKDRIPVIKEIPEIREH